MFRALSLFLKNGHRLLCKGLGLSDWEQLLQGLTGLIPRGGKISAADWDQPSDKTRLWFRIVPRCTERPPEECSEQICSQFLEG